MTVKKAKLIPILMCSATLIIGLILLIAGIRDLSFENKDTKGWETTEGTLVDMNYTGTLTITRQKNRTCRNLYFDLQI